MSTLRSASVFLCLYCGVTIRAGDWPQFRGPDGSGVADVSQPLPTNWSSSANLAWKTPMPGPGVSSPIVVNGKVFVTCYSGYGLSRENPGEMKNLMRHLVCVDLQTGKVNWQQDVKATLPEDPFSGPGVPAHGYASHTPVSDGENVYAFFGKGGVHAFDMDGNHLWQADVGQESDPAKWGSSSSPILHEDTVIITAAVESQSVVGLDKATGNELWRQPASRLDNMWGTPSLIVIDENRTDLVMCVPGEIWGLDPNSGKLRWYAETAEAEQVDTSAVLDGTRVYAFSGRGGGSIAIDAGGLGNVTKSNVLWTGPTTARFSSPVRHGSQLYLISRRVLTVIDADTGKKIDQVRLKGARTKKGRSGGDNYSSPIIQGDRLFYPNGSGQVFVFALGDEPKQLAVNQVTTEPEMFGGSPAVSDGRLLLRSNKHLYCITDLGQKVDSSQIVIAQVEPEEPDEEQDGRRRTGGRRRIDPMNLFTRRDTNNDGELAENELSSGSVSQRIAGLDKDGDKVVTKEEFRAGAATISRRRSGASRPQRPERPELAE